MLSPGIICIISFRTVSPPSPESKTPIGLLSIPRPPTVLIPLKSKLNQSAYQVRIGQSVSFPELGIHTDTGKTRKCVDFIYIHRTGLFVNKKIHPRKSRTIQGLKSLDRIGPYQIRGLFREVGR